VGGILGLLGVGQLFLAKSFDQSHKPVS
jgi:hypothetical protein